MQKSAKFCMYEKNTVLRGLFVALGCLIFSSHCVFGKDVSCHDGKFIRKDGADCNTCVYCTKDRFNSYFGTEGDRGFKNVTDRYCPGFGDEDYVFAYVHPSLPKNKVSELKNKMLSKHDCNASSQFGVRSCAEDFNTDVKHYFSRQIKTTEGKTDVYNTCYLYEVYCEAGFWYSQGDETCNRSCVGLVDPVKCPAGWHVIFNDIDYTGVLCETGTIPTKDRSDCCKCPDGYAPNDKDITVFSDGSNTGNTVFKGRVCVNKEYKNETSLKDTPELIWRCESLFQAGKNLTGGLQVPQEIPQMNINTVTLPNSSLISQGSSETTKEPGKCKSGQIKNKENKCVSCTSKDSLVNEARSEKMYCDGESMRKCPRKMKPNSSLSGCECIWGTKSASGNSCENITLSKQDLKCGPEGCNAPVFKQCWTKTTAAAYRKCMGFD